MALIKAKDKRSGITYVYESKAYWDKEKKQSRSTRTLIGRLDEKTGEVVPTDGRCKRLSPAYIPDENEYRMPKTVRELKTEVLRLLDENASLKEEIRILKSKKK